MRACNCARASPFQSRTCEGCDPQLSIRQTMRISFNPCIRVGCDFRTRGEDGTSVPVSIHAPAWGATYRAVETLLQIRVSIHAPAWGATYGYVPVRPRMPVSIHAPAWGATMLRAPQILNFSFQSTHPRGVRPPLPRPSACRAKSFNPRTRVGCDHAEGSQFVMRERVSIHAPAWGATGVIRS